jgi:hypothetical protein
MKALVWKYYFWVILALDMVSFIMPLERRVWEIAETGFFLVALCGLFGFCWGWRILSRLFWQLFLVAFLSWLTFYFCIRPPQAMQATLARIPVFTFAALAAVTALLHIPLVSALFLYAFRRADIWGK